MYVALDDIMILFYKTHSNGLGNYEIVTIEEFCTAAE